MFQYHYFVLTRYRLYLRIPKLLLIEIPFNRSVGRGVELFVLIFRFYIETSIKEAFIDIKLKLSPDLILGNTD